MMHFAYFSGDIIINPSFLLILLIELDTSYTKTTAMMRFSLLIIICLVVANLGAMAQREVNYDESKILPYELPQLLTSRSGKVIADQEGWDKLRRHEILEDFEKHVYGKMPEGPVQVTFKVQHTDDNALGGLAIKKEIVAVFRTGRGESEMNILLYLPKNKDEKVPVFLGLNFYGNHSVHEDPSIIITKNWVRDSRDFFIENNQATEASRGVRAVRWPVEAIIKRGYGMATIYSGDLDPDYDDGFQNGIQPLFYRDGQNRPETDEWGTIGAWAWGLIKAMDYFETDPDIDSDKIAVLGHSRLGKAALWAGAQDQRFAMVISNNSGCGGAALSRRKIGETVEIINTAFPHWFCGNFHKYNGRENDLPIDQHMLLALIAPRPVYVASAQEDLWADPKGEFLSLHHSGEVYKLFGHEGLVEMPQVDVPVTNGRMGYHIRTGKHDITLYDWERYMDFADAQWNK